MRLRTALPALTTATLLLAGCAESYDDKANACMAAIKARPKGDTARPGPCEEISEHDYDTMNAANAIFGD
jgi:Tfp pilus assembly protein PilP